MKYNNKCVLISHSCQSLLSLCIIFCFSHTSSIDFHSYQSLQVLPLCIISRLLSPFPISLDPLPLSVTATVTVLEEYYAIMGGPWMRTQSHLICFPIQLPLQLIYSRDDSYSVAHSILCKHAGVDWKSEALSSLWGSIERSPLLYITNFCSLAHLPRASHQLEDA